MHTYTPSNSKFDGPITNLLSVLCIVIEILSHAHQMGEESLRDFKFGTFWSFSSDSAAVIAVKGLIVLLG